MYFAVLQGGAEGLASKAKAAGFAHRVRVGAAALPMAMFLRGYSAALRRLASVRVEGAEPAAPAVLCAWHQDLFFLLPERGRRSDWLALPAEERLDPIARASEALGFRVLREAFGEDGTPPRHLVELVSEGARALLSVDGPKQPGLVRRDAVKLAVATGAPLVPVVVKAPREARLPGGMHIVLPRGEISLRYGAPIAVRAGGEEEALAQISDALRF
jgi:lysophospholipid acyltransferase (LPLAT)-like uncharacterized protein